MKKSKYNNTLLIILFTVISIGLYSPSINNRFIYDDFMFISIIEENIQYNPLLGFWSAGISESKLFESIWWTDSDAEGEFFRPVPSLVITTAYGIWGKNSALPLHFLSALLHGINAFLVYLVLVRISNKNAQSLLAGFIYLICVHHVISIIWIATNTDLFAVLFMLLSIYSYIAFRKNNKVYHLFLSLIFQLIAFGCKETASVTIAAIILYELILVPESGYLKTFFKNWKYWAGSAALTFLYLIFYKIGGFGITSILYYDPFLNPLSFIKNLFIGYPIMFLGLLSPLPFSFPAFMPELLPSFFIGGLIITALFIIVLIPYRKDKVIIYCFVLFVIAILPQLSADASERQLYFPFTAGSFIISSLIFRLPFLKKKFNSGSLGNNDNIKDIPYLGKIFSYYLLLSMVIISFLLMLYYPYSYSSASGKPEQFTLKVKELADKQHADKIYILNIPGPFSLLYLPDIYRFHTGTYTDMYTFYAGNGKLWIKKTNDSTFSLKTDKKGWLSNFFSRLPRTNPLIEKGKIYSKKEFTARVTDTINGDEDILEAEFIFKHSLTSPGCLILHFDGEELRILNFAQQNPGEWILIGDTSDVLKYMM